MEPSRPFGGPARGDASSGFSTPFSAPFSGQYGGDNGAGGSGRRNSGRGRGGSRADTTGAWGHEGFQTMQTSGWGETEPGSQRGGRSGRGRGRGRSGDESFAVPFFSSGGDVSPAFGRGSGRAPHPSSSFASIGGAGAGDSSRPFGDGGGQRGRRGRGGAASGAGASVAFTGGNPFGAGAPIVGFSNPFLQASGGFISGGASSMSDRSEHAERGSGRGGRGGGRGRRGGSSGGDRDDLMMSISDQQPAYQQQQQQRQDRQGRSGSRPSAMLSPPSSVMAISMDGSPMEIGLGALRARGRGDVTFGRTDASFGRGRDVSRRDDSSFLREEVSSGRGRSDASSGFGGRGSRRGSGTTRDQFGQQRPPREPQYQVQTRDTQTVTVRGLSSPTRGGSQRGASTSQRGARGGRGGAAASAGGRGDDSTFNAIWVKTPQPEQNTRAYLYPHFSKYGKIQSVTVERNFSIVKFATYEAAEAALRGGAATENPAERLRLSWAKPKRETDAPTSPRQAPLGGAEEEMGDATASFQDVGEEAAEDDGAVHEGDGGEEHAEGEEEATDTQPLQIRRTIRNDGPTSPVDPSAPPRLPLSMRIKFPARPAQIQEAEGEAEAEADPAEEGDGEAAEAGEEAGEEEVAEGEGEGEGEVEVEGEGEAEDAGGEEEQVEAEDAEPEETSAAPAVRRLSTGSNLFRVTLRNTGDSDRPSRADTRLLGPLGGGDEAPVADAGEVETAEAAGEGEETAAAEGGGEEEEQQEEAQVEDEGNAEPAAEEEQEASAPPARVPVAATASTRSRLAARIAQARGGAAKPKGRGLLGNRTSTSSSLRAHLGRAPPSPSPAHSSGGRALQVAATSPKQPAVQQAVRRPQVHVQRKVAVQARDLSELRKVFMEEQSELHQRLRQLDMENMCAASERQEREMNKDLSRFEMEPGTEHFTGKGQTPKVRPEWAVKKYHRPTVDLAGETPSYQRPEEVRPPEVLLTTMEYLTQLLERKDVAYTELEKFVRDRTRAIRQDFVLQRGLMDDIEVEVVERICRFHIVSDHRLCEEDQANFDQQMNLEQLNKSLITLSQLYADHAANGIYFSTEAEFRSYFIITHLDTPVEVMGLLLSVRPEVYHSLEVQTTLAASSAIGQGNYARFFDVCRKAPYLLACLLHRYWNRVRAEALSTMNTVYGRQGTVTLAKLVKVLGLEDENEAENLCRHFGLPVGFELAGNSVFFGKCAFVKPKQPLMRRVSHTIIEPKSGGVSIGDIVELPTVLYSGPTAGSMPVLLEPETVADELEEPEQPEEEEPEQDEDDPQDVEAEEESEPTSPADISPTPLRPTLSSSRGLERQGTLPATLPFSRAGSLAPSAASTTAAPDVVSAPAVASRLNSVAPAPAFVSVAPMPAFASAPRTLHKPLSLDMHFVPIPTAATAFAQAAAVASSFMSAPTSPAPTPAQPAIATVRPQRIAALQAKRRKRITGWAFENWRKVAKDRREQREAERLEEIEREREYRRALSAARLKPHVPLVRWELTPESRSFLPVAPEPTEHLRLPLDVPKLVGPIIAHRNPGFKHVYWKAAIVLQTDDRFSTWLLARLRKGAAPPATTSDEEVITAALWQNNEFDPETFERRQGPPLAFCVSRTRYAVDCAAFDGCTGIVSKSTQRLAERQRLFESVGNSALPVLIVRRPPSRSADELPTEVLLGSLEDIQHKVIEMRGDPEDEVALEEGIRWLATTAPPQPLLSSMPLVELVHAYAEHAVTPLFRSVEQGLAVDLQHMVGAFNQAMELLAAALGANATENADYCWPPAELRDFFLDDARAWQASTSAVVAEAVANCCLPDFPAECTQQTLSDYVFGLRPIASGADFYPLDERLRRALAGPGFNQPVQAFKALYHYALALLGSAADEAIYFPKGIYSQRFKPEDALQYVPYELGAPLANNEEAEEEAFEDDEDDDQLSRGDERTAATVASDAEMDEVSRKRRQREEGGGSPEAKRSAQADERPTPQRATVSSEVMEERLHTQDFVNRLQVLLAEG